MSLLFQRGLGDTPNNLIPARNSAVGSVTVSADSALNSSAVWACLRLRADLISTLPVDSYRVAGGLQVEIPATPFLKNPGGDRYGITDWLYASQFELDRTGNAFGIIRATDGYGLPAVVELVQTTQVVAQGTGCDITGYRIGGMQYAPSQIWHERQFVVPGVPFGLSPVAYGAMSIGSYQSAQQFALDWFANGSIPAGKLKNTAKVINAAEADIVKGRFSAAVANRELFVHGSDWEYDMISVNANESQFIETMNFGIQDIARFFGVPGDMIDAPAESSAKITYANITQRNLQLLVTHLGPAIRRREAALTSALPQARFVKFNTDAVLRMDPQTREAMLGAMIASRQIAPSEARALDNRLPYTSAQLAEFDQLFGGASSPATPPPSTGDVNGQDA